MKRRPSTSQTCAPWARATKYGVPPTERNARTGEFTPPGIRSSPRRYSDSFVRGSAMRPIRPRRSGAGPVLPGRSATRAGGRLLREPPGGVAGEVGEDEVRAGPLDGGQLLERHPRAVDPPVGGGGLDHRVLAGH